MSLVKVENIMDDYIVLKGRCGIEYYDQNGKGYSIDSELFAGGEYDYAIYIDSLMPIGDSLNLNNQKKLRIVERVLYLCRERGMKPKIFYDNV